MLPGTFERSSIQAAGELSANRGRGGRAGGVGPPALLVDHGPQLQIELGEDVSQSLLTNWLFVPVLS
jgi:hypothetical protein